jgi:hypothetical protein
MGEMIHTMNKSMKIFIIFIAVALVSFTVLYQAIYAEQLIHQTPDGPMWYNPDTNQYEEVTTFYNTDPTKPFNMSAIPIWK